MAKSGLELFILKFHEPLQRLRHTLHQRTLYSSEHFASQELNTLGSPKHFAMPQFTPQHTLLLNTLCHSEPFTSHYTLLLDTLCHSEPLAPQNTLLLITLCSSEHFALNNTLLLRTLCSSEHYAS
jgi:hypothetical protein